MKTLALALVAMALAGFQVQAGEMKGHGNPEFCAKHCGAMELQKEVKALEASVQTDQAALKTTGGAGKLATANARAEKLEKHLAQHEAELKDLKARVEKAQSELKGMENK